jgi:ribosomal protein S18 acetylase RimI-like enzyme
MTLRAHPKDSDRDAVLQLVRLTGFFSEEEQGIAVELVEEALAKGKDSGYEFLFADDPAQPGRLLGYTCYGPIPGTRSSYDLYWIAVTPGQQGNGLGRQLLVATEGAARTEGATQMYADTSGQSRYAPTRKFYERMGYRAESILKNYFAPGDDKVIFSKTL